ncbi:uroporphyrinogen-III C-methyltransferase, partial [Mediterraneibacter gnavus]
MESQQKKKTGKGSPSGKVWLAGAGPGDASLLTLKVKKWMDEADVIIYDALISAEILSLIPDGKEWIYVGKRSGHHCVRQEEINQILLREAKAGKNVLRLKGGDPFVFGRGAEEVECLAAEGIPFEIIPGVTSALAVPAYAGIPIT